MQDTNINSPRLSALDRLKMVMEASREYFRNIKHLAYERRGDNGAIGRISRFMAKTSKSALGLFGRENTWTALALSTAFSNSSFDLLGAIKNLNFFSSQANEPTPQSVTEQIAQTFDDVAFSNTYVTASVAAQLTAQEEAFEAQLQVDVAQAFDKISERVASGEYVGIQGLVAELNAIQETAENAHGLKAMFDAQGPTTFAHCSEKVAGMMKAEFCSLNEAGAEEAQPSERILTFDAVANPQVTKTPITSFMPTIPGMVAPEAATVPVPVLAVAPPRPQIEPRGI